MKRPNRDLRFQTHNKALYPGHPLLIAAEPTTMPPGGWWFLLTGIGGIIVAFIFLIVCTAPRLTREDFVILRGQFVTATEDADGSIVLKLDNSARWFRLGPTNRPSFKTQEFQNEIAPGTPLSVAVLRVDLIDEEDRPFVLFEVASDTKRYLDAQPLLAADRHHLMVELPFAAWIILMISSLFFGIGMLEWQQGRIRPRAGWADFTDV